MAARFVRLACASAALGLVVISTACSSGDTPPPRNGVDDIVRACQLRAAWKNPTARTCVDCVAAAPSPECDCESFKDFGALCRDQDEARRSEPSCTGAMEDCARLCGADCACVEGCYVGAPGCKRIVDARDGCVVDVCAPYCN